MIVLRSAVFSVIYIGSLAWACLYGTATARNTPARAFRIGKWWARVVVAAARRICRIELQVTGLEHVPPTGAALIAPQHQSAYDTLVWFQLLPWPVYVLKQELAATPLFGRLSITAGMIPVDRAGGGAALRGLMRAAVKVRDAGRPLIMFPEGTRAAPGIVPVLQPGIAAVAAKTGLPVIPVLTDSGRCWGRKSFMKYPGTIHLHILPALPAGLGRAELLAGLTAAFTSNSGEGRLDGRASEPVRGVAEGSV